VEFCFKAEFSPMLLMLPLYGRGYTYQIEFSNFQQLFTIYRGVLHVYRNHEQWMWSTEKTNKQLKSTRMSLQLFTFLFVQWSAFKIDFTWDTSVIHLNISRYGSFTAIWPLPCTQEGKMGRMTSKSNEVKWNWNQHSDIAHQEFEARCYRS